MIKVVLIIVTVLALLLASGFIYEQIAEARDARTLRAPGRLIAVQGTRRLHIHCTGNGPGPTVVIEQGSGSPSVLWWTAQKQIGSFARVCTYDRAGYQWSDPASSPRSLADRVEDLHQLLTKADVPGPYVLVAHSFGGPLIRLYARLHPQHVVGMVLVDTPEEAVIFREAFRKYTQGVGSFMRTAKAAARCGIIRLALKFFAHPEGPVTAEMNRHMISFIGRPSFFDAVPDEFASLYRATEYAQLPGGFGSLEDQPLIVITHGQRYPGPAASLEDGFEEGQKRLATLSSDSELIVARQSNHMIWLEEPDLVIDAIRRVHAAARDHQRLAR